MDRRLPDLPCDAVTIRHAMNGAKIPNWAKLLACGVGAGWVAACTWSASNNAREKLAAQMSGIEAAVAREAAARAAADSLNALLVHIRMDDFQAQLGALAERVDYRSQQTRNQISAVGNKVDQVRPVIEKIAKKEQRNGAGR